MKKILLISVLFFFLVSITYSQESRNMSSKEHHLRTIFNKIVEQVHDGEREKPKFVFFDYQIKEYESKCGGNPVGEAASMCPCDGKIFFDEWFYDEIVTYFKDSTDNFLSFILGHEIVHYYKHSKNFEFWVHNGRKCHNHGIMYSKTFSNNENISEDSLLTIEQEADIAGLFYCFLAGYNPKYAYSEMIGGFYEIIAKKAEMTVAKLDKSASKKYGYFPLDKRKKVSEYVLDSLRKYESIYNAANYLYMIGSYEDAVKCYEHLTIYFPSKDIVNNLGLCYAELALKEAPADVNKYKFPFTIEDSSYISKTLAKGEGGETNYSQLAKKYFNLAIRKDKEYWKAYINLASIYLIEEQIDSALAVLNKIEKSLNKSSEIADMNILKGIAYARQNKEKEAIKCFKLAIEGNRTYAEINLKVLAGKVTDNEEIKPKLREYSDILNEKVCGTNLETNPINMGVENDIAMSQALYFVHYETEYCKAIANSFNSSLLNTTNKYYFLTAKNKYAGTTYKGIKINDNTEKLKASYGEPNIVFQSGELHFWVYSFNVDKLNKDRKDDKFKKVGLVFAVNKSNGLIDSWILYYKQ